MFIELSRYIGVVSKVDMTFNLFVLPERAFLARYLKIYSYRQDKAQELLLHGLELRKKNPYFFTSRDPFSPELKTVVDFM